MNTLGAVRVIRAFYPMLAQSEQPRILNVSSGLDEAIKRIRPELNGHFLDRNGRIGEYPW